MSFKSLVIFTKILTFLYKSLHFFENVFKKPQNLSKCPYIDEINLNLSKIISKSLEFFEKALDFLLKFCCFYKSLSLIIKSHQFSKNVLA
jgi:hypothetical protein